MKLDALLAAAGERDPMPFTEVRQLNPNLVAHVDGDYMAYFASGNDSCSAGDARRNVLSRISHLKSVTGASKVVMHLTHGASTKADRFLVAETQPYQGQRKTGRKPVNWQFLREWMETYTGDAYQPKIWTTREADDGIAYVCESVAKHKGMLHVVHTADKDLRMFCGIHVEWKGYKIVEVPLGAYDVFDGKQYGHKWFWQQMLQGDAADHIPGLRGVAELTAARMLEGTKSNADAAPIVYGAYSSRVGEDWHRYFAEQALLLWMRTDRNAELLDVLQLGVFGPKLLAAFHELAAEVREKRANLEALKQ